MSLKFGMVAVSFNSLISWLIGSSELFDVLNTWNFNFGQFSPVAIRKLIFTKVLSIIANALENWKTWSGSRVCVYVEYIGSLNLLEKSHRRISLVILHHF